jgi:PIN domain
MRFLGMKTALIFDTCSLPQKGGLTDNPLMSAIIRIAEIKGHELLISEVVRIETLAQRGRAASAALEKLRTGIREVSKIFGSDQVDYYMPSEVDAVSYWQQEIDEAFKVIPLAGEDAIEALHREARRIAPARPTADGSSVGSRDAAIWLSVKRFHLSRASNTCLISGNTGDFSDAVDKRELKQELLEELGDAQATFFYFISLSALIGHIAEEAEKQVIDHAALERLRSEAGVEASLQEAAEEANQPAEGYFRLYSELTIQSAEEVRAYKVDETRLSMIQVTFRFISVEVDEDSDQTSERRFKGEARMWAYGIEGSLSVELETLKPMQLLATSEDP